MRVSWRSAAFALLILFVDLIFFWNRNDIPELLDLTAGTLVVLAIALPTYAALAWHRSPFLTLIVVSAGATVLGAISIHDSIPQFIPAIHVWVALYRVVGATVGPRRYAAALIAAIPLGAGAALTIKAISVQPSSFAMAAVVVIYALTTACFWWAARWTLARQLQHAEAARYHSSRRLHEETAGALNSMICRSAVAGEYLATEPTVAAFSIERVELIGAEALVDLRHGLHELNATDLDTAEPVAQRASVR
ncbi:hypothetical protein [Cryptosporangium aurantiacum]|uniref:Uncharacterized protein n=1 Tax=Cryptosporangium aurantiacum TaxID=134849 RepID=A0A1M7RDW5_9ACTN|nr:hypothetical protein [Cryptosporangium aurantiacum]SHN44362.1 hypothetical protein SAMN05443668_110179 [Cryptosporangium aurantiacum]